ncbi:MAG: hypothetical protein Q7S29_04595 [Candidatus Peribacter sp.]|nr:hypothetical protein [Candidatus Peribacter sp.]
MSVTSSETVARDTPTTDAVDTASRVAKKVAVVKMPHCTSGTLLREFIADSLHRGEMSKEEAVRLMRIFDDAEIREMEGAKMPEPEKERALVSRGHQYAIRIWQLLTLRWSKSQESEIQ